MQAVGVTNAHCVPVQHAPASRHEPGGQGVLAAHVKPAPEQSAKSCCVHVTRPQHAPSGCGHGFGVQAVPPLGVPPAAEHADAAMVRHIPSGRQQPGVGTEQGLTGAQLVALAVPPCVVQSAEVRDRHSALGRQQEMSTGMQRSLPVEQLEMPTEKTPLSVVHSALVTRRQVRSGRQQRAWGWGQTGVHEVLPAWWVPPTAEHSLIELSTHAPLGRQQRKENWGQGLGVPQVVCASV